MEDLKRLTIDDIIEAMRINGIRSISIDTITENVTVTEWYGSQTVFCKDDDRLPYWRGTMADGVDVDMIE